MGVLIAEEFLAMPRNFKGFKKRDEVITVDDDNEYLSPHFRRIEFVCKCGCNICNVDNLLIVKLEMLRSRYGKPLSINSGCRCKSYNEIIKGSPNSQHITTLTKQCLAVDIHCPLGSEKHKILEHAFFLRFKGIGVGDSFIHLDLRVGDPVVWHY